MNKEWKTWLKYRIKIRARIAVIAFALVILGLVIIKINT